MSMAVSVLIRTARNAAMLALLDAGGSTKHAYTEFRTGERPAIDAAASGTLVATAPWAYPSAVLQSDGSLKVAISTEVLVLADGAPTWARTYNGNDVICFDCDVTPPSGSGDMIVQPAGDGTTTKVYAGAVLQIASGTIK